MDRLQSLIIDAALRDPAALPPIVDQRLEYAIEMAAIALQVMEPDEARELSQIINEALRRGVRTYTLQSALES